MEFGMNVAQARDSTTKNKLVFDCLFTVFLVFISHSCQNWHFYTNIAT